jgi:hypothetical protein
MIFQPKPAGEHVYQWVIGIIFVGVAAIGCFIALTIRHAEPFLRELIVDSLSRRFHGRAELGDLHVSIARTVEVSGDDLKVFGPEDPDPQKSGVQPLIANQRFWFSVSLFELFHSPLRVDRVYLQGLDINIPPAGHRGWTKDSHKDKVKIKLEVNELVCEDARLVINSSRPDKLPLEFAITQLRMNDIGPQRPSHFEATLINPKPIGKIQSIGLFGPWRLEDLRSTPLEGHYSFSDADLSTINGIGGILSSIGEYRGTLGSIIVDGKTDTPDFRLAITNRPVPLHTDFHAIVDGTNGNVTLQPVNAKLLNSTFTANGSIVRVEDPKGHRILLDVDSTDARIDDLLKIAIRTDPPMMTGRAAFKAVLKLPPGTDDVMDRMQLAGTFRVSEAHFTSEKIQSRLDGLSLRAQGRPKEIRETHNSILSQLDGTFSLANRQFDFRQLHFAMPGTNIVMAGTYSLDGNVFDFHGKATLEAKPSQMTTGWKSALLKPLDPLLDKHGEGTVIPISIRGTKSEPHIGLDFRRKDKDGSSGK